jgi:hypothetical protein
MEWHLVPETASKDDRERLLLGLQFSLRWTAGYISPKDKPGFLATLTTSGYKIQRYETSTGYVFLLLTHQRSEYAKQIEALLHSGVPPMRCDDHLYELDTPITLPLFDRAVEDWATEYAK